MRAKKVQASGSSGQVLNNSQARQAPVPSVCCRGEGKAPSGSGGTPCSNEVKELDIGHGRKREKKRRSWKGRGRDSV